MYEKHFEWIKLDHYEVIHSYQQTKLKPLVQARNKSLVNKAYLSNNAGMSNT